MITLKNKLEVEAMRKAGKILAEVLEMIKVLAVPGCTTIDIDKEAERLIIEAGCRPAFKGYRGFTGTICASINDAIVHGVPNNKSLKDGDILTIDCGVVLDYWYADSAYTIPIGSISEQNKLLLSCTEESLYKGIEQLKPGARLGNVGSAIQKVIESAGFKVVQNYGGHGIGRVLHEEPFVANFGVPDQGLVLREGMVLALEPMAVIEDATNYIDETDGWTVYSTNHKNSAHFEHTIAITADGYEILTK